MHEQEMKVVAHRRPGARRRFSSARAVTSAERLCVRVRHEPERACVTPVGELDLATAGILDEHLTRSLARTDWVVLDLRALTFMDCAGLRVVVSARWRASCAGRLFEVVCVEGQVAELLTLLGLTRTLNVIGPG